MSDFIEVHVDGYGILVNLEQVEEIRQTDYGAAEIYFAFTCQGEVEQDRIVPDESYADINRMIFGCWR